MSDKLKPCPFCGLLRLLQKAVDNHTLLPPVDNSDPVADAILYAASQKVDADMAEMRKVNE